MVRVVMVTNIRALSPSPADFIIVFPCVYAVTPHDQIITSSLTNLTLNSHLTFQFFWFLFLFIFIFIPVEHSLLLQLNSFYDTFFSHENLCFISLKKKKKNMWFKILYSYTFGSKVFFWLQLLAKREA